MSIEGMKGSEEAQGNTEKPPPPSLVIVGGGIAGLTLAYRLAKRNQAEGGGRLSVTVVEPRDVLGGNIQTLHEEGCVIDGGPDAFVVQKPEATALCKELGLGDRLIETIEENRKVFVLRDGKLHGLPEGMVLTIPTRIWPMVRTSLFSWPGKLRMAMDLWLPRREGNEDESLGDFMRRRLGKEMTERLADPLLGGIFAGDVYTLSARSTFPQLVELEEKHGGLIRGVLAQRAQRLKHAQGKAPAKPPSAFYSLVGGMGELSDTLEAEIRRMGVEIRLSTAVKSVKKVVRGERGFEVELEGPGGVVEKRGADFVVLATRGYSAAEVVRELDIELAGMLEAIPYTSTAAVILGYKRASIPHPMDGVGVILPKSEGRRVLALTFVTSKWAHRAPSDVALLRVFMGGHQRAEDLKLPDEELVKAAVGELCTLIGVHTQPMFWRVFRHERASAQPTVGHGARVSAIRERMGKHPGLYGCGAAFQGVGIPDCVRQANETAERIWEKVGGIG